MSVSLVSEACEDPIPFAPLTTEMPNSYIYFMVQNVTLFSEACEDPIPGFAPLTTELPNWDFDFLVQNADWDIIEQLFDHKEYGSIDYIEQILGEHECVVTINDLQPEVLQPEETQWDYEADLLGTLEIKMEN